MFQRTPHTDRPTRRRSHRAATLACLLAIVALVGAGCGDSDDSADPANTEASGVDGYEFTSPDKDYSVTFPSEPTAQPTPLELPGGQSIEIPLQVASAKTSEYTTGAITYPDDVPVSDDVEKVLDGALDGAVANVQGAELGESEDIEVDGLPGRRFDFTITQGDAEGRGEAIFILDGQVLYQAIAVGEADDADAHAEFLDSFEIL